MANWTDIGIDNFKSARLLYDETKYRSSVSRFYYAAFSTLTSALSAKGVVFRAGNDTPGHSQLPGLIETHLTQFSEARRYNLAQKTTSLYRLRLAADYSLIRLDKRSADQAHRLAAAIFDYLEVKYVR